MTYRDPVCGMTVDPKSAAAEATHGSQHFYFCSTACRDRFDANPAQYVGAGTRGEGGEEPERHEPPRTTLDGVTSPKFGSAGSGGAEYESVPEQHEDE